MFICSTNGNHTEVPMFLLHSHKLHLLFGDILELLYLAHEIRVLNEPVTISLE